MRLYFGRLQQLPSLLGLTGGTGHPTFPPITHLIPFYLLPFFPTYHSRRLAGSQITFLNTLHIRSLFLQQKDAIFRIELPDAVIAVVVFYNCAQELHFW